MKLVLKVSQQTNIFIARAHCKDYFLLFLKFNLNVPRPGANVTTYKFISMAARFSN
jgi:hypothetical protein